MNRVACYIRVSTEEQKLHGISLDAQRDKLKEYADKHELKIVGWYEDEGVSGRKPIKKRPELQRMIKDAQLKLFDRIIFIKLDRFFRSVAEYHECMKLIHPVIWTATEEKYDLSTANGRAFVNMKITIAELEADQTGERIKIVNDYKVKQGQAISGYKSLTMGYTTAKVDGVKKVVKNKDTAHLVTEFLRHFLTYHNTNQAFRYVKDKYQCSYGFNAFRNILFDTHIYGSYRGNDNYNEPYITKDEFDKIQDIMKRNIRHTPSGNIYLFTGLIKCPKCGTTLSSRNSPYGKVTCNPFYRCNKRIRERTCDNWIEIKEVRLEDALIKSFDTHVDAYIESATVADNAQTVINTAGKLKALKDELTRLNSMYQKGRITEGQYDREYDSINEQIKDLEKNPVKDRDLSAYQELLASNWTDIYNALNRENKRAFWRKYIKEIHVHDDGTLKDIIFL